MSTFKKFIHIIFLLLFALGTQALAAEKEATTWNLLHDIPAEAIPFGHSHDYGIGEWDIHFGNHRALVTVEKDCGAAAVRVAWRRRDIWPERKNVMIYDPVKKQVVDNRVVLRINREFADIVFEPTSGAGTYEIYYLQWDPKAGEGYKIADQLKGPFPITRYFKPAETASADWLQKNKLTQATDASAQLNVLPKATVKAIEALAVSGPKSQREFNSFFPMEIIATEKETNDFVKKHAKGNPFVLFPEDRTNPIKMPEDLPLNWITRGLQKSFSGTADKNEFYVFQIGVYALDSLKDVSISFSGIKGGITIPASAFRCFNMGGVD